MTCQILYFRKDKCAACAGLGTWQVGDGSTHACSWCHGVTKVWWTVNKEYWAQVAKHGTGRGA